MRTDSTSTITESTIESTSSTQCTIDPEGMAHIQSILTHTYSDTHGAALREYACNARDSHIAAGTDAPVEVTLPTHLSPTLTIQDYGVGLSHDEVLNIYSRYGASTKRDTNTQIGAFGIGSKAGFTVGNQFVVTAVKDGEKTVALFAMTDDIATVDVLTHEPTSEPNGVRVAIAVDNPDDWHDRAENLFLTWEPGTVLVDGQHPAHIDDDGLRLTADCHVLKVTHHDSQRGVRVVMGGVAYPVSADIIKQVRANLPDDGDKITTLTDRYLTHTTVGIGDVDLTPSREGLRDTSRTVKRITRTVREAIASMDTYLLESVEAAPTFPEAARTYVRLTRHLQWWTNTKATWRGQPFNRKITSPHTAFVLNQKGHAQRTDDAPIQLDSSHVLNAVVVTGVPSEKIGAVARGAGRYLNAHEDVETIFAVEGVKETREWFAYGPGEPTPTITLEDFRREVRDLAPSAPPRREVTYTVRQEGVNRFLPSSKIKDTYSKVLVFEHGSRAPELREHVTGDHPAIVLDARQTKRAALERFPQAEDGDTREATTARALTADPSPEDAALLQRHDEAMAVVHGRTLHEQLHHHLDRITNARFVEVLERVESEVNMDASERQRLDVLLAARRFVQAEPDYRGQVSTAKPVSLLTEFPLLAAVLTANGDSLTIDHAVAYLNAHA